MVWFGLAHSGMHLHSHFSTISYSSLSQSERYVHLHDASQSWQPLGGTHEGSGLSRTLCSWSSTSDVCVCVWGTVETLLWSANIQLATLCAALCAHSNISSHCAHYMARLAGLAGAPGFPSRHWAHCSADTWPGRWCCRDIPFLCSNHTTQCQTTQ